VSGKTSFTLLYLVCRCPSQNQGGQKITLVGVLGSRFDYFPKVSRDRNSSSRGDPGCGPREMDLASSHFKREFAIGLGFGELEALRAAATKKRRLNTKGS